MATTETVVEKVEASTIFGGVKHPSLSDKSDKEDKSDKGTKNNKGFTGKTESSVKVRMKELKTKDVEEVNDSENSEDTENTEEGADMSDGTVTDTDTEEEVVSADAEPVVGKKSPKKTSAPPLSVSADKKPIALQATSTANTALRDSRKFKTLVEARKFACKYVGENPEVDLEQSVARSNSTELRVRGTDIRLLFPQLYPELVSDTKKKAKEKGPQYPFPTAKEIRERLVAEEDFRVRACIELSELETEGHGFNASDKKVGQELAKLLKSSPLHLIASDDRDWLRKKMPGYARQVTRIEIARMVESDPEKWEPVAKMFSVKYKF